MTTQNPSFLHTYENQDPGIIQIESFGIHINCDGLICYGLHLESVMDRVHEKITLDHLARVMVDIQQVL